VPGEAGLELFRFAAFPIGQAALVDFGDARQALDRCQEPRNAPIRVLVIAAEQLQVHRERFVPRRQRFNSSIKIHAISNSRGNSRLPNRHDGRDYSAFAVFAANSKPLQTSLTEQIL
jgi:hypothetical protein